MLHAKLKAHVLGVNPLLSADCVQASLCGDLRCTSWILRESASGGQRGVGRPKATKKQSWMMTNATKKKNRTECAGRENLGYGYL